MQLNKTISKAVMLLIVVSLLVGVGSSATDTLTVTDSVNKTYDLTLKNVTEYTPNLTKLWVENTSYTNIQRFNVTNDGFTFTQLINFTSFTIIEGGSGTGVFSYDDLDNRLEWDFNNAVITNNVLTLEYDYPDIVNQISIVAGTAGNTGANAPIALSEGTTAIFKSAGNIYHYQAVVSNSETVTYTDTYPLSGKFVVDVEKDGNINSKVFINSTNDVYCNEAVFNSTAYSCYGTYGSGLYINLLLPSGATSGDTLINSSGTGIIGDLSGNAVEWQNVSYNAGDTATISYSVDDYDDNANTYYIDIYTPNNESRTSQIIVDNLGTIEYLIPLDANLGEWYTVLIQEPYSLDLPVLELDADTANVVSTAAGGQSNVWFNITNATQYKGSKYGFVWNITDFSGFWNDYYMYVYRQSESSTHVEQEVYSANSTTDRLFVFDTSGTWTVKIVKCPLGVCSVGSSVMAYYNLNVASPSEQGTFSVVTDQASYQTGDTIVYTVVNPSLANAYMTVRSPDGIISSELGFNTIIPPENGTTIYRQIPNGYAKGEYTVNIAHTEIFYPVLAQATFSITTASATSNTLSLIWGSQTYNQNDNGLLSYSGNFNTSTLTVYKTDATGALVVSDVPYSIGVNDTGSRIVYFDKEGSWKANIIDSGNSANSIWANISVYSVDMYDIDPDEFKNLAEYCLWDNKTYIRGQPFTIDYKFILPVIPSLQTWQIELINPDNEIYYTQELNITSWISEDQTTDSFSGIIPVNSQHGVYQARLMQVDFNTGNYVDEIATSYMTVVSSDAPYGADAPPTDGTNDLTGTGFTATGYSWMDNLLYFMSLSAFWGFIFFIVVVMVVATNKTASPALGLIAFVTANIEAVIGLWAPFTMYILVLTWVFAGIYFVFGRKIISGL